MFQNKNKTNYLTFGLWQRIKSRVFNVCIGGFPLRDFFRAKRKACLYPFVSDCGAILIAKQKNQKTLFASREKVCLVEICLNACLS